MSILITLIRITGSVGLFLYGMKILSDGLQKSAGNKLKSFLELMTSNRFMAVFTGLLITVIIQSSSATTVMVVSFVNAGLMNLVQAIGVIMGANIGTTVTGWIVAILGFSMDITVLSLFAIAIALPLMFSKGTKKREISEIFLGFGFLFLGLEFLQSSMPDVSGHTEILQFLARFDNGEPLSLIFCVLVGTVLTCIVQSSSATMALTITMAYQGWIGAWTACALCLGQNIGTTITAYIASIGTSTNARRAAMAHIFFNVIGSVIAMIFFTPLMMLVNVLTPGDVFTATGDDLRAMLPAFLAMFHTVFNLINTILFFPFVRKYAAFIEHIVPEKKGYESGSYHFSYIANTMMDTPEIYLLTVGEEVQKMGKLAYSMFSEYSSIYASDEDIGEYVHDMKEKEEYADQMQEHLINFSVRLLQDAQTPTNASRMNRMIRIIDETESITDSVFNLTKLAESRISNGISYSEDDRKDLADYNELTLSFLSLLTEKLGERLSEEDFRHAQEYEDQMNEVHRNLSDKIHARLSDGVSDVKSELMILEVIRNIEHIGDYLQNIAEASYRKGKKHSPELQDVALKNDL